MTSSAERTFFVGSYAEADRPGIHAVALDERQARFRVQRAFSGVRNPSFLALHHSGDWLYAVSETGIGSHGTEGAVHAFRIERHGESIDLVRLNERSSAGDHPCHLSIDAHGRWIAVSNYGTGSVAILPIAADGSIGESVCSVRHTGTGSNPHRQEGPHAHSTVFAPDGRFLLVADLGIDQIVVYSFDADDGSLVRHETVNAEPGAGPRHMAFHPDGTHLFVVNELRNTVTMYRWDVLAGFLQPLQTESTVRSGSPANTAADIHVSPSGDHIYVSNRGDNSVAVYGFDQTVGMSRLVIRSCGGEWPRSFDLTPSGRHLVVANRRSNEIVLLPTHNAGGNIVAPIARLKVAEPSSVVFS